MVSTPDRPGPFDGMERAAPGEPVFTLAAHDILAAPLVQRWVDQRRAAIARAELPEERRELELIQVREAEEIAFAMVDWRLNRSGVSAEPEAAAPARYSGNTMTVEELSAKAEFDRKVALARQLRNAEAELAEVAESVTDSIRQKLANMAYEIRCIANDIEPKRKSYAHRAPPDS